MAMDPKKRRFLSRSDEEVMKEIDDENEYRKGWPFPLPAMPVFSHAAPSSFPDADRHLPAIRTILNAQKVSIQGIQVIHRTNSYVRPVNPDSSIATLCITSIQAMGNWVYAIREIRKYLSVAEIDISIEIVDYRVVKDLQTFTILPSDKMTIEKWNSDLRGKVLDVLRQHSGWATLNVFHRGVEAGRNDCPRTVLLSVPAPHQEIWTTTVIPQIAQICRPYFKVELHCSGCMRVADNEAEERLFEDAYLAAAKLTVDDFGTEIAMGNSCGSGGSQGSGSLGGALRLEKRGVAAGDFALTNSHVIQNDLIEQVTASHNPLKPEHGLVTGSRVLLYSPSDKDTNIRLKHLEMRSKTHEEKIDGVPERDDHPSEIGLREQVEMGCESKVRHLRVQEEGLQHCREESKLIKETARRVGALFAASGYRTLDSNSYGVSDSFALDWALARLADKTMQNQIVKIEGLSLGSWNAGDSANAWTKIRPGMTVAKRGRSTGWTRGEVNSITTDLGDTIPQSYGKTVSCFCIVGEGSPAQCFAMPGDSGAIVLELGGVRQEIRWVGLLFAAQEISNFAYVTPIDIVFQDIEDVTGCDIVEPTFVKL